MNVCVCVRLYVCVRACVCVCLTQTLNEQQTHIYITNYHYMHTYYVNVSAKFLNIGIVYCLFIKGTTTYIMVYLMMHCLLECVNSNEL